MVALFYLAVPRILASFNLVYTGVAAVAVAVVYYFLARWGLRDMQKRDERRKLKAAEGGAWGQYPSPELLDVHRKQLIP